MGPNTTSKSIDSVNKIELPLEQIELVEKSVESIVLPHRGPEDEKNQVTGCNVIGIASPVVDGGSANIASALALALAGGKERVLYFDCCQATNESSLVKSLRRACREADRLVVNLGEQVGTWRFQCGFDIADVLFWVVRDEDKFLEQAKSGWAARPRARCREILILKGQGSVADMEKAFMLPCIQVNNNKDIKQLKSIIEENNFSKGKRVLAVGLKKIPEEEGVVWDVFSTALEAMEWIRLQYSRYGHISEESRTRSLA